MSQLVGSAYLDQKDQVEEGTRGVPKKDCLLHQPNKRVSSPPTFWIERTHPNNHPNSPQQPVFLDSTLSRRIHDWHLPVDSGVPGSKARTFMHLHFHSLLSRLCLPAAAPAQWLCLEAHKPLPAKPAPMPNDKCSRRTIPAQGCEPLLCQCLCAASACKRESMHAPPRNVRTTHKSNQTPCKAIILTRSQYTRATDIQRALGNGPHDNLHHTTALRKKRKRTEKRRPLEEEPCTWRRGRGDRRH